MKANHSKGSGLVILEIGFGESLQVALVLWGTLTDHLVRLKLKWGKDLVLLVHVEVQATSVKDFAKRIFIDAWSNTAVERRQITLKRSAKTLLAAPTELLACFLQG